MPDLHHRISTRAFHIWLEAGEPDQQELAHWLQAEAIETLPILPITEIIALAQSRYAGRITEAELEDGPSAHPEVYEITFQADEGEEFEVTLDARTGELLAVEGEIQLQA
jgi:uncharacterized membrane protein YkoI